VTRGAFAGGGLQVGTTCAKHALRLAAVLALVVSSAACLPGDDRWHPEVGDTWHLQLQGDLVTDVDVDVYDVDLFDTPVTTIEALHDDGRKVVCYVNVGAWEEWRDDADDWPSSVIGEPLEGWPGERWVDVRRLDAIGPLIEARLDLAVEKGCDGVDPDNVDGHEQDTGFAISRKSQLAYLRFLVREAHERDLAIGLKNAPMFATALADHVDFAVNEQCIAFEECDALDPFIEADVPIFGVEYEGDLDDVCAAADDVGSWLLADLALDGRAQLCP
jgi:hypothetical protein